MNTIVIFLLWFLLAQALLSAAGFALRKKSFSPFARAGLIAGKALLAVGFAALVMAGPVQLRALQPLLMALYAALLPDALADALYSGGAAVLGRQRRFGAGKALSLALSALFFVYGVVNMQTVTPNYHTYTSTKLKEAHTVVFLADVHVGSAQPFSVTEKTVAAVKALPADAVILGGDFVDDYTTKEEMNAAFGLFRGFEAPVYFIYGNHDRQGHAEYAGGRKFTPEEMEAAMAENGIVVLKDAFVELAPDLWLLGREDLSEGERRAAAETLACPAGDAYLIVADHQPGAFKQNLALGADLQLSGHTHAGQLFPLGLLYSAIGSNCGDYHEGDAVMNVSAGVCGWRMPFRTDRHCHYEVVELKPAAH